MTRVTPLSTAFEVDDSTLSPGTIFRKQDGSLWKVNPNGSQSPLTSGGAGDWGEASTAKFSGVGSPVGVVTPTGVGDLYVDETPGSPALYQAGGDTSADWVLVGGGGSQPGALASADFLFTEEATAGTYTATLPMPSGAVLLDAIIYPLAVWAADTASLSLQDGGASIMANAVSLDANHNGLTTAYDPTSVFGPPDGDYTTLAVNDGASGLSPLAYAQAILPGGSIPGGGFYPGPGRLYQADDTLTVAVTSVIAVPPVVATGITLVKVFYFVPVTRIVPVFA